MKKLLPKEESWKRTRPSTSFMRKYFDGREALVGLEIGVYFGNNAKNMLINLPIKKLYLVDCYELQKIKKEEIVPSIYSMPSSLRIDDPEFQGIMIDFRKCFKIAKKNLAAFEERVKFIRKQSIDAVDDVPNNLDFIYIDADHNYLAVLNDLKNYYPKLRKDGIISGHDFCSEYYGVAKAVLDFAAEKKLNIKGRRFDWWMIKK